MMRYSNNSLLLHTGMADAAAIAAEYVKVGNPIVQRVLRFERYEKHPTYPIGSGLYTDDTEMLVANAKVLLGYYPRTPEGFAEAWLAEFCRGGKRKGYGRGMQLLLESATDQYDLLRRLESTNETTGRPYNESDKNGAAMRSAVFGVIRDIGEMLRVSTLQARITHNTEVALFSARAVALMSHYALYQSGPLSDMGQWCARHLDQFDRQFDTVFTRPWSGKRVEERNMLPVSLTTVWAVAHLLRTETSLMDMLRRTVEWGGDTDTVAAVAWGIASARYGGESLPAFMARDLEKGDQRTGAQYLLDTGTALMHKYKH